MQQLYRIFLFFSLVISLGACNNGGSILTEAGVSLELAKYRKASINNVRYDIHLIIPKEQKEAIRGQETIYADIIDLSGPLIIDFKVPVEYLLSVITNGQEVDFTFEDEHIIIDKEYLQAGENIIELSFRVGETSLNRNPQFLYTLFVPDRARTAFPCFDQPNLKARYTLTLTIPEAWVAIANGALTNETKEGGIKTLVFAETKPLSTYLFDFVAGEFIVVEREAGGRKMTMLHRESDSVKVTRNLDEIFNLHVTALDWLEDYTGIEYPFQKFGFALIPSFQYGGMEHPGAITYKASSLFLAESATQNRLMGRASLIAHETAHMWFGDMVTMNWFDDVWMKEVFANFMAAKIVNPTFPNVNHELRFLLAHYPGAYAVDRSSGTHPIQQPLANLKDAGTLYGSIIYQKAPIVMRKLERRIGKDMMQQGLREYLSEFAYGNATWDDLIGILDSVSEEKITLWSNRWAKTKGMPSMYPYIRTRKDSSIREFSLHQRSSTPNESPWPQQLSVILEVEDSIYHYNVNFDYTKVEIDEAVGLKNASFLICNSKGYGYGYFRLGPLTSERLLNSMHDFEDPVLRGVGWISLWEEFLRQRIDPSDMLKAILANLETEPDLLIQQHLLGRLHTLYWKFLRTEQRLEQANVIEDVLWNQIEKLTDIKLKSAYLKTFRSIALTDEGVEKLYKLWHKDLLIKGINLSENDYTQLSYQLALRGWQGYEGVLDEQTERIINTDRKARMNFLRPALSNDQAIRDAFFESLKEVSNREHESWVQQAVGFLHHPLRADQSKKYITPTLEMLEELQQTGDIFFPKRILDNTFWGHQSPDAVNDVRQFLYRNNHFPENLKNKILQATDLTFRAAEMLKPKEDTKVVL